MQDLRKNGRLFVTHSFTNSNLKYKHFLASTEIKTEIKTEPGIVPRIKLPGRRCENCNKIMKRKGEGYYECPSCTRYLIFVYCCNNITKTQIQIFRQKLTLVYCNILQSNDVPTRFNGL